MKNQEMTLLIMTCSSFSDLWEGQIRQLKACWPEHPKRVLLVTDEPAECQFEGIEILAPGKDISWSRRLHEALKQVETPYVFFTLDDYFLIRPVKNARLQEYAAFMDREHYDYIGLYWQGKQWTLDPIPGMKELRRLDLSRTYAICLYAGIWRRDFLLELADTDKNPWQFEVSLAGEGLKRGASCAASMDHSLYPFLDVVRKGKLLRKASRYLKARDLYHGSRQVNSLLYELKGKTSRAVSLYAPDWFYRGAKGFMHLLGFHFYSDEA